MIMNITPQQMRKVWAVAKERGLDQDDVRQMAKVISGMDSVSHLTKAEAIQLIDRLEGRRPVAIQQTDPNMATVKQLWKIDQLIRGLGWDDNPKRLEQFMLKYAGVAKTQWLTKRKAIGLIDGLKKILDRQATQAVQ